jgi:hypothetical protein
LNCNQFTINVTAAAASPTPVTATAAVAPPAAAYLPLCVVAAQNHKLLLLEGADHTFSNSSSMYELAAAVLPFIVEHGQQ